MGNQQVRLAWLAGIIDGEGTISVEISTRWKRDVQVEFQAFVQVVNTDMKIIEECQRIANMVGTNGYIWTKKNRPNDNRKTLTILRFSGYNRGSKILNATMPYLVAKRRHAELFLEIAERRLKAGHKEPYSIEDFEAWYELKTLNAKGIEGMRIKRGLARRIASYLRDYTPGPQHLRDDIVHRVMKVAR